MCVGEQGGVCTCSCCLLQRVHSRPVSGSGFTEVMRSPSPSCMEPQDLARKQLVVTSGRVPYDQPVARNLMITNPPTAIRILFIPC